MGSKTFLGVRFAAYSDDHLPPHVHGFYAGIRVVIELDEGSRRVRLANRKGRIKPRRAKRSDVAHVVDVAGRYFNELWTLWENA